MPTIQERITELRTLMANFTVRPIDPGDASEVQLYFPFHDEPGEPRGRDVVADLKNTILLLPEAGTCQLFSGFQGTGKSTELRRLTADLQTLGFRVLFVEGSRYINIHQPLEISDLLLAVAAAVGETLQDQLGTSPLKQTLVERMSAFFGRIRLTQIDAGLSASMGLDATNKVNLDVAKLRLELKQNPTFKAKAQDFLRGTLSEFLDAFKAFMQDARDLMGATDGACPVLIVDDLEKVRGSGQQEDAVTRQIEQIFSSFRGALKIPGWHTIWTSPPYLPFLNTSIANSYDGYVVLPMVRLWRETDVARAPDEHGFSAMRGFLRTRGNVGGLVTHEALLDQLILASSGHIRDLCKLMQDVLRRVIGQKDPRDALGEPIIQQIVNDYVAGCQKAVYVDDHPFFRAVAASRRVDVNNESQVQRIAKLIDTQLIMIYRNGKEWFDVSVPVQRTLARATTPTT